MNRITINLPKNKCLTVNDAMVSYAQLRQYLPEHDCIEVLASIKKKCNKKIAVIMGNCQTYRIAMYLPHHSVFGREYLILKIGSVHEITEEQERYFKEDFWNVCDLLISQRISEQNRFTHEVSSKKFMQYLPETSKIVWIPNIYFDGYFPQYKSHEQHVGEMDQDRGTKFYHGDKYVDAYMETEDSPDIHEIIRKIQDPSFLSENLINQCVRHSFHELERREWACDLHILDYIEANYGEKQLFYSPNHPLSFVIMEMTKRVLDFIGIHHGVFYHIEELMNHENPLYSLVGQDVPVYPSVLRALRLREYVSVYYANLYRWKFRGDIAQYLETYIRTCWKEKLG